MSSYLVTIEFDDGARAITRYSSPSDVRTKLAEVVRDLTDEDSIEHFRSVTVTQAPRIQAA
jgi:ligand-binding sensor protein